MLAFFCHYMNVLPSEQHCILMKCGVLNPCILRESDFFGNTFFSHAVQLAGS